MLLLLFLMKFSVKFRENQDNDSMQVICEDRISYLGFLKIN